MIVHYCTVCLLHEYLKYYELDREREYFSEHTINHFNLEGAIKLRSFENFDPLSRSTVRAGSYNYFHTYRPSVTTFQNLAKQNNFKWK